MDLDGVPNPCALAALLALAAVGGFLALFYRAS